MEMGVPMPRMRIAPAAPTPPRAPRPPRTRIIAPEGRVYIGVDADDIEGINDEAMRAAEEAMRSAEDVVIEVEPLLDLAPMRVELRRMVRI